MNSETVQYKRTLRGSVGSGMGSLLNGNGRSFFILEHKSTSAYHKAGESQKIIIDQVEIGRSSSCQVQFDESFQTVSRRHAAIVRDGNRWKLVQLSQTNCTLLNGHPVETEWYLENGDEIQLSAGGPKLGFIVPSGKQSLVSSIKMTERLELFRKQALAPYKTTIACLAAVLVVAVGIFTYKTIVNEREMAEHYVTIQRQSEELLALRNSLDENTNRFQEVKDSLTKALADVSKITTISSSGLGVNNDYLNQVRNSVYMIYVKQVTVIDPLGIRYMGRIDDLENCNQMLYCLFVSGTGFMLEDGTFVTAKHVVQPHLFAKNEVDDLAALNQIVAKGGTIEYVFAAKSPNDSFEFTSTQVACNSSCEIVVKKRVGTADEARYRISPSDGNDWAYVKTSRKGNIVADFALSTNLKSGTKLAVLGYPESNSGDNNQSVLGSCMVAVDGISKKDRVIWTTERNFEHGNSGGPVFVVTKGGKMKAVGIVSSGTGDTLGFLVPLSNINMF